MTRFTSIGALLIGLVCGASTRADFILDLTSITAGGSGVGTFAGTLGSVGVTGSILAGPPVDFVIGGIGVGIGNSTIDGSSPAYSYPSVFDPTNPFGDRIGWTSGGTTTNIIKVIFSSAVTNPVFHVANLDSAMLSFTLTPGFTSLTLLNGNGSAGDGLAISGATVFDMNPATFDMTLPSVTPPTSGARSAYGSVQINGTFTSLFIGAGTSGAGADLLGSFTLSAESVPEPSSLALIGFAGFLTLLLRRRSDLKKVAFVSI